MGQYVNVENNVRVYVEDIGEGTPVVFLHGWPANHNMFEQQFLQLPMQGLRCIGLDMRGFGKSDAPWESYTYDRLSDDVRAVIDELKLKEAVLVGFSIGGAIATRYMARHNGHGIARLVLAGAATPVFTQREGYKHGIPKAEVEKLMAGTLTDRPLMLEGFGKTFGDWLQALCLEASAVGTFKAAASLRDEDLRGDLHKIHVPTAVFHGVKDKICPFELAELTARNIPNAELVRFEDSGHAMLYDEPVKFTEQLVQFAKTGRVQQLAGAAR